MFLLDIYIYIYIYIYKRRRRRRRSNKLEEKKWIKQNKLNKQNIS